MDAKLDSNEATRSIYWFMEISGIEEQVQGQYKEATVKFKMWEILWNKFRLQETYRGILNMCTVGLVRILVLRKQIQKARFGLVGGYLNMDQVMLRDYS